MRAVVCQNAELEVVDRPEPVPGKGQVRIEVLRCGICGSDLHARHGLDVWADLAERGGLSPLRPLRPGGRVRPRVLRLGRRVRAGLPNTAPTGSPVVALPLLRGDGGVDTVGLSMHAPGAYADQLLVEESMMMPVPNGPRPISRR